MANPITLIELSGDSTQLLLTLGDGGSASVNAAYLRSQALDAQSRRHRLVYGDIVVQPDVCIASIHLVGASGVNIVFSDGHDRAIFPFRYLKELAGLTAAN